MPKDYQKRRRCLAKSQEKNLTNRKYKQKKLPIKFLILYTVV